MNLPSLAELGVVIMFAVAGYKVMGGHSYSDALFALIASAVICGYIHAGNDLYFTKKRYEEVCQENKHLRDELSKRKAQDKKAAQHTPDFTGLLDAWLEKAKKEDKAYRLDRRLGELNPGADITKEVTLGYWDEEPRLDIRKWENMDLGKGISLTEDEVRKLREILDATLFGT